MKIKNFRQFCREIHIVPTEFQCSLTDLMDEIADLRDFFDRVTVTVDEALPLTVALTFEERDEIGD